MENNDGIFKKMFGSLGLGADDEDDELELDEKDEEYQEKKSKKMEPSEFDSREDDVARTPSSKGRKVVSIGQVHAPKVILKKPKEMEDMMEVVDAVKTRKIAVINLLDVDLPLAQRMIDYIGGACYAMNGKFAQISHLVYIVVGENVDLTNYIKTEINKKHADSTTLAEE